MVSFSSDAAQIAPGGRITITCKLKNISGQTIRYMSAFVGTLNNYDYVVGSPANLDAVGDWKNGTSKTFLWVVDLPTATLETRNTPLLIRLYTASSKNVIPNEDTFIADSVSVLDSFCTPRIEQFDVVRMPDDESSTVTVNVKLAQSDAAYGNSIWNPQCILKYAADGYGGIFTVNLTDKITDLLTGSVIELEGIDPAYEYDFVLSYGDALENAISYTDVANAFANLALSETGKGASFGMFPTGNEWLESAYPLVPYSGVAGVNIYILDNPYNKLNDVAGTWVEIVENHTVAKPIRRVTVSIPAIASGKSSEIVLGVEGKTVERIVSIDGMFDIGGGSWVPMTYSNDADIGYHVRTSVINVGMDADLMLYITTGSKRSISGGHATIAYVVKERGANA